jgi:hypothetical protein
MQFKPKDIPCSCGHVTTLTSKRLLCIKCGKYVFYDENEKRAHRRNALYVTSLIVLSLGLIAYFFVELVLNPLMSLK